MVPVRGVRAMLPPVEAARKTDGETRSAASVGGERAPAPVPGPALALALATVSEGVVAPWQPVASVAVIVTGKVPGWLGVPDSVPTRESEMPPGSAPVSVKA